MDWSNADLSYLQKATYDATQAAAVAAATLMSVGEGVAAACPSGSGSHAVRIEYSGLTGEGSFEEIAQVRVRGDGDSSVCACV